MLDKLYKGQGTKLHTTETWRNLPKLEVDAIDKFRHPSGYLAQPGLVAAVNVALELGMPLLLTGEPGCGKSDLAHSLAWELNFPKGSNDDYSKPLCFTVKSDTQSRDLFYTFDTLGRFRAARVEKENADARQYLRFEALGLAILRVLGPDIIKELQLQDCLDELPKEPQNSVVLIDEIDKAPREVPNDILNEIGRMGFDIPELFETGKPRKTVSLRDVKTTIDSVNNQKNSSTQITRHNPVIIITSNRERELPEAFLRRCVYYHLGLPNFRNHKGITPSHDKNHEVTIENILETRLGVSINNEDNKKNSEKTIIAAGVALFHYLRTEVQMLKPPSIAELLNWMKLLQNRCDNSTNLKDFQSRSIFISSAIVTLFKQQEDQEQAGQLIQSWLDRTTSA